MKGYTIVTETGEKCFVHQNRSAEYVMNGSGMHLCGECAKESVTFYGSLSEPFVDPDLDDEIDTRRQELGILDVVYQ
jgi:hypothetical protein